ncbi:MAG: GTP-binding protein [Candidatus Rokubacteria bacterium]|nr:GTP-binding protein [Candidatus Rokubacteria bacterium]
MEDLPEAPAGRRRLFVVGGLALLALALSLLTGARVIPAGRVPANPRLADLPVAFQLSTAAGPIEGQVIDAETRNPIAGASIHSGPEEIRTDAEGRFTVERPAFPLIVKAPGYERRPLEPVTSPLTMLLRPQAIKAAYLTYFGVGDRGIRSRVFELLGRTELNAVVIDVKGDRGLIPYRTQVPLALEAGAQGPGLVREFDQMLAELKAKGVYTIARIVVFKDSVLAHHRPDWAVIDTRTGQPWLDNERLAWVDPFREEVWEYAIAIAREAAEKGFDEIQFDYVRFPTDGKLAAARYSRPNTRETRLPAIADFLARARKELAPAGIFLAADVFGYTAFNENDTDIGQRIEELAVHVDYLSPMVYPSGYHRGIPGYPNPVEHPYKVVFESVKLIRKRSAHLPVKVRPWIQDFRDYAFDRRPFGVKEVQAQARGAADAGAVGWMLWNPRNHYTAEALRPKPAPDGEPSSFW